MRREKRLKHRDWRLRITDILDALERIEGYVAGQTRELFLADRLLIDAVVRNLEIIGEAARHVPGFVKRAHNRVPWDTLREFRNYLAHEYFGVDHGLVWETVTRNLPPLRPAIRRALLLPEGGPRKVRP